jgi:hypothetical protein
LAVPGEKGSVAMHSISADLTFVRRGGQRTPSNRDTGARELWFSASLALDHPNPDFRSQPLGPSSRKDRAVVTHIDAGPWRIIPA